MKYCIYDTETTGMGNMDEVIEFCAMLFDGDLTRHTYLVDFYCMSTVEITKGAFGVHGIDIVKLRELSREKYFEEYFSTVSPLLEGDVTFIAYNDKFDRRLINQTLRNSNSEAYDFGNSTLDLSAKTGRWHFDPMTYAKKHMTTKTHHYSQRDVLESLSGFNYAKLDADYKAYKNQVEAVNPALRFDFDNEKFHNARYDVYALYQIVKSIVPMPA